MERLNNIKKTSSYGFTLAEVLIVLAVLGIVAVLTVPSVVKKYFESQARMKIKKSMAAYDTAINKMVIENDLRSEIPLKDWAESDDCANSVTYFKRVESDGCTFKTSDGVWWDIEDITNPIIAMSENALQDAKENGTDGKKSFKLVTSYDALLGTFRVDDLGFEKKRLEDEILQAGEPTSEIEAKIEELEKLFGFALNIKEEKVEQSDFAKNCVMQETAEGQPKQCKYADVTFTEQTFVAGTYDPSECYADSDTCADLAANSIVETGTYWIANIGGNISWNDAKTECAKMNAEVATAAQLQQMYSAGTLRCQDGSMSCGFWAFEATSNDDSNGVGFNARYGNVYYSSKDSNTSQVLCVGK